MTFSAAILLGLCALFLGGAAACPARSAFRRLVRGRGEGRRGAAFLVMVSLAAAAFAAYVVRSGKPFPPAELLLGGRKFLLAAFAAGFALSALWRFLLVPALLAYGFVWWSAESFLRGSFPAAQSSVAVESESEVASARVFVCRVAPEFPFPVARFWLSAEEPPPADGLLAPLFRAAFGEVSAEDVPLPPAAALPARWRVEIRANLDGFELSAERTL